jgi:hypothetical protein
MGSDEPIALTLAGFGDQPINRARLVKDLRSAWESAGGKGLEIEPIRTLPGALEATVILTVASPYLLETYKAFLVIIKDRYFVRKETGAPGKKAATPARARKRSSKGTKTKKPTSRKRGRSKD